MTASNDAFRRISPLMRTIRIARTISETVCILMDDVRIEKNPDGTISQVSERTVQPSGVAFDMVEDMANGGSDAATNVVRSSFGPVVSVNWVMSQASLRANRIWSEMLTDEERQAISHESTDHDDAPQKFVARVMRRLIGYHYTAANAASLCSMTIARMLDPEMVRALRHICGWGSPDPDHIIRAWDRTDAAGRQVGMKNRPVQIACLARLIGRHIRCDAEGNVGILAVMGETRAQRERDDEAYMASSIDVEHPWVRTTGCIEDLCEIADLLPSALRSAGVKPSFWRMVLRMRPSQIHAMRGLFVGEWDDYTSRTLNTLTLIGEDLLPPTLIRQLCRPAQNDHVQAEIRMAVAQLAAKAVAARRRRQSLRDAVDKIQEVCDHLNHRIEAMYKASGKGSVAVLSGGRSEGWAAHMRNVEERNRRVLSLLPSILPKSRTWSGLVADSDAWHEESHLALDEGDSRSWKPLLTGPVRSGEVEIVELHTAAALRTESRALNHCVGAGGYAGRCMNGTTRILSLSLTARRTRSTMEIVLADGRWRNVQHRGRSNSVPKPVMLAAVSDALRAVNRAQKALDARAEPMRQAA